MAEISNLAYVGFGVGNLAEWEKFAVDILGMEVGSRTADTLALRMDEYRQRIFLEENPIDDLLVAGWEFDTESDLDAYVNEVREKGTEVTLLSSEAAARRKVEKLYACPDPNGFQHEFFFGADTMPLTQKFRSAVLKGGFETGPLGIGHILPLANNGSQTVRFYEDVLKLRISDYIRQEIAPGIMVDATFFHSKTGRHHSIATAQGPQPLPKVLNHLMLQVQDMDDVGLAYDRAVEAGLHIAAELGHHPHDRMFSFYVRSPSGFNVEFGYGGIVIDDTNWKVVNFTQMSDWGHKRNPYPGAA